MFRFFPHLFRRHCNLRSLFLLRHKFFRLMSLAIIRRSYGTNSAAILTRATSSRCRRRRVCQGRSVVHGASINTTYMHCLNLCYSLPTKLSTHVVLSLLRLSGAIRSGPLFPHMTRWSWCTSHVGASKSLSERHFFNTLPARNTCPKY